MSGEQPSEGGGYTEVQAGPPAHAPAPPIPAVRTLHNPFFVTGLVGGDEQTPSSGHCYRCCSAADLSVTRSRGRGCVQGRLHVRRTAF